MDSKKIATSARRVGSAQMLALLGLLLFQGAVAQSGHVNVGRTAPSSQASTDPTGQGGGLGAGLTLINLVSQPGDHIGRGASQTLIPGMGTFTASRFGGVSLVFHGQGSPSWIFLFRAPFEALLTPGAYEDARGGSEVFMPSKPRLDVSGAGSGCNTITGRFDVLEAVYGTDGSVLAFAADFEQHCGGDTGALFGSVRYQSSVTQVPASMVVNAGDNQSTVVSGTVPIAPSVRVLDSSNVPVAGVSVTFAVTAGGGNLTGETQVTNSLGIATVGSWRVGGDLGQGNNKMTASASGGFSPPVTFTASVGVPIRSISAGLFHTCAVTGDGLVQCWGNNFDGELGDGTTTDRTSAVAVLGLTGVVSVSAGGYHTCALTNSGGVKCWGYNGFGGLGDGTTVSKRVPVDVVGLSSGVAHITAGLYHSCATKTNAELWCWGNNGNGQLGDGTTTLRTTPAYIPSGGRLISAGAFHTCGYAQGLGETCWGSNLNGKLGDGSTIQRLRAVNSVGLKFPANGGVFAGVQHTCAFTSDGTARCWGANAEGQLGDGTTTPQLTATDVSAGLTNSVTGLSVGNFHNCVVRTGGGVKCWGRNNEGQLGDGTGVTKTSAVDVVGLGSGVTGIAAGGYHTCALTIAGAVKCWGHNAYGGLGNGTFFGQALPVDVSGLARASISDASVAEGSGGRSIMAFTVTLAQPSASDVVVTYATGDGTAVAGADYTAATGRFTIPAGYTSRNIAILVDGDNAVEAHETLTVTLSDIQGGLLARSVATGTILNDDAAIAATATTQYRLYSAVTLEHLYTTDFNEYTVLGTQTGVWMQEGIAYQMLTNGVFGGVATVPLFRLYHPGIRQHHWTTDSNEAVVISREAGWDYEGTIGYVLPTQITGTVPLYRMALAAPPLHLWTTDLNEYNVLATRGWVKEGIIGYVIP
jgi:alpha-tubulin suppressor-like RCC1 family protein